MGKSSVERIAMSLTKASMREGKKGCKWCSDERIMCASSQSFKGSCTITALSRSTPTHCPCPCPPPCPAIDPPPMDALDPLDAPPIDALDWVDAITFVRNKWYKQLTGKHGIVRTEQPYAPHSFNRYSPSAYSNIDEFISSIFLVINLLCTTL